MKIQAAAIQKHLIRPVLDLLFPPKCACCGRIVRRSDWLLCPRCEAMLTELENNAPVLLESGLLCAAPFYYEEPLRQAFLKYKFGDREFYAPLLGDFLRRGVQGQLPEEFDLVTWAPLSKKRLKSRGYDQAKLLAQEVATALELPLLPLLEKRRDTKAQSGLDGEARRNNVKDVYGLRPGAKAAGLRILLVDDVVTTGSTLSACAQVLTEAGAARVCAAALACHKDRENL